MGDLARPTPSRDSFLGDKRRGRHAVVVRPCHAMRSGYLHRAAHPVLMEAPAPVSAGEPRASPAVNFSLARLSGYAGVVNNRVVVCRSGQYSGWVDRCGSVEGEDEGLARLDPLKHI